MIFAIESSQHPHDLITALPIASKRCPLTEHFWSVAAIEVLQSAVCNQNAGDFTQRLQKDTINLRKHALSVPRRDV